MDTDNPVHIIYYGKDIIAASKNCLNDSGSYDNEKEYKIISAKLLQQNVEVGFTTDLCEAWEFRIFLIYI